MEETVWPEFQELAKTLNRYLSDLTDRVVQQVLHEDSSEAEIVDDPKALRDGARD